MKLIVSSGQGTDLVELVSSNRSERHPLSGGRQGIYEPITANVYIGEDTIFGARFNPSRVRPMTICENCRGCHRTSILNASLNRRRDSALQNFGFMRSSLEKIRPLISLDVRVKLVTQTSPVRRPIAFAGLWGGIAAL